MTLRRRPARRGTLAIIAAAAAVIAVGVAVVIIALGSTGSGHRRLNGGVTGGALVTPPVTLSASPGPGPASPAAPAPGADPSPHPVPPSPDTAPGHATPSPSARRTGGGPATSANSSRVFTVVNATSRTIWVAATRNSDHPLANTGWRLAPGATVTFPVPSKWGGRIWGRTGCAFDGSGHGHCVTGDCAGGFQCTASGATPATLAEFSLGAWNGLDFYDVSLVDGSNLPMYINISHTTTKDPVSASGCVAAGCTKPVACPAGPMRVMSGGTVAGCRTACAAYGGDAYCCRGAWSGRANCDPAKWPVDYTAVFKKAEPYAYSYAYDDSATMSCRGGCDYRITFGVTPGAS